ncbi:MAG: winged helix DNA-binding protein [Muricomes sp.]
MNKNQILEKLTEIAHQPFFIFVNEVEEKVDNTLETLKLLAREEDVTAGRISEVLDIKPSSVTQIIKKLEEAGTAVREKSENDSRVTFVRITDKGRESLAQHSALGATLKDVLFKEFSDEELEQLNDYLGRMVENISGKEFQEKLKQVFSNDKHWERFSKMSAHLGRAREQMMERSGFGGFDRYGRHDFDGRFGGFENWKRGRK